VALPTVPSNGLEEKQYATAILRLLLDKRGKLVHGEVVDVDGGSSHRFGGWQALIPAVQAWLITTGRHDS
jgi:hypothetical protein